MSVTLAGTIIQQINGQPREIPRQLTPYLPIDPQEECLGRDEDLRVLALKLDQSQKVVVVNGLGGIGKTTLAKAWFQSVLRQYEHFLWIELAGNDNLDGQQYAASFIETIAWHPTLAANLQLEPAAPNEPPEARFHTIMNALRQLKGPNLFVVDNAGAEMEQAAIRAQMPLPPEWRVLLTSRNRLNGYEPMPLDRLSPEAAAQLFRKHYTGDCPPDALDELLREVDCHTLTVELLAKTLENHFGSLDLSTLTAKLRRRQLADPDLQRRISSNHSKEETEVYIHLLTAFDCSGLDAAERLLLARFVGLPPGYAFTAAQLEEWLQVPAEERRHLHETLDRLDRKGWLTRSEGPRFGLHRMLQQAVGYQLTPGMEEWAVLVETFTQKLNFDVSTNYPLLFPWITYAEHLLEMLKEEDLETAAASRLMNNLGTLIEKTGQYERARDLLEGALASAVKNFGPDHPTVAAYQSNLANVYDSLGQYERARDLLEGALASAVKNFGPDHPTVAVSQSNLANVYLNLGQYERARDLLP
ncbi:MAG: tetratricopeptide repeat protein [Saprospiraceae bacterium]